MFDAMTETLTFVSSDTEKSPLLVLIQSPTTITWVTVTNSGIDSNGKITSTVLIAPDLRSSGLYYLKLKAFDGAMYSDVWTVKIDVTYDPPNLTDDLVNQKMNVGRTLLYRIPASKNTVRGHPAVISSPGLVYFGSVTSGGVFTFKPPFT